MASLQFKVTRKGVVLVPPLASTPKEFLYLPNIDDQGTLRFHIPVFQFYRFNPSVKDEDPARVIREGLAKVLVFYYPLAGRVRDAPTVSSWSSAREKVTRLRSGGFILAIALNHTLSDAFGLVQFRNALAEMGKGATSPSVLPVWERESLRPRTYATVKFPLYAYDQIEDKYGQRVPANELIHNSFFFGHKP
eukprot:PITA_02459